MTKNNDFNIGSRLKHLRDMLDLTQIEIAEKAGRSPSTIVRYEQSDTIRSRDIQDYILFFKNAGINVSQAWIFNGEGPAPMNTNVESSIFYDKVNDNHNYDVDTFINKIHKDISLIKNVYQNFHYIFIDQDKSMVPRYYPNEYIGGVMLPGYKIYDYHDKECVVYTSNGTFIGKISINTNVVHIVPLNNECKIINYNISDITSFFKIIWHRTFN